MKTATIRTDVCYVVDLYKDGILVESRSVYGHSLAYAESLADNWKNGVISKEQ